MKSEIFLTVIVLMFSNGLAQQNPQTQPYMIDTNQPLSVEQMKCMWSNWLTRISVQVYDSRGFIDENGIKTIGNCLSSKLFDGCDGYITPCLVNCQNNITDTLAQTQAVIKRLVQEFPDQSIKIWVVADKNQPGWSSDKTKNQPILLLMIEQLSGYTNFNGGVVTNYNSWAALFGASYTKPSSRGSLMWINWNGAADWSTGWTPFGGWDMPDVHQYIHHVTNNTCAPGVALNYDYPAS